MGVWGLSGEVYVLCDFFGFYVTWSRGKVSDSCEEKAGKLIYYSSRRHTAKQLRVFSSLLGVRNEPEKFLQWMKENLYARLFMWLRWMFWHPERNIDKATNGWNERFRQRLSLCCTFAKLIFPSLPKLIFHWKITAYKYLTWYTVVGVLQRRQARRKETSDRKTKPTQHEWLNDARTCEFII